MSTQPDPTARTEFRLIDQLLGYVAPGERVEVERRYAESAAAAHTQGERHIDGFARDLNARGLLSSEGLHEFLTCRAPLVGALDDAPSGPRYEAMAVLGRGGMGEVFLGSEPALMRTVAVKRIHGDRADPVQRRRFVTEAQVTAQLDHPAIVPVYGFQQDPDGALAYAMKFVRGVTLSEYIAATERQHKAGKPDAAHSLKQRVATFLPVLNALAYAHQRGVIHRDLKPDNVMIGRFGEVLVLDWGIARLIGRPSAPPGELAQGFEDPLGPSAETMPGRAAGPSRDQAASAEQGLTRVGAVIGTPDFMSPEQARGEPLDPASDQYALGLMLQALVTLRPPIPGRSRDVILERARAGERAPIGKAGPSVPRELRAIIAKACALDKGARYASVEAMADDVRRFLRDESVLADPDSGVRRIARWIGNHRVVSLMLGGGLLLLAFTVGALMLWRGEVAVQKERQRASERERAVMNLGAIVDARANRITEQLRSYEALLNEVATSARIYLSEPAPPSQVVVYRYTGGVREPAAIPEGALESKVYGQVASLQHADFTAAPELDRAAMRAEIDQLARLAPVLRSTLLASAGDAALRLSPNRAESLVLQKGVPLVWAYFGTASGLSVGLPGTWTYAESPGVAGYDHRKESWYAGALATRDVVWSSGVDEAGLGLLLGAAVRVRGDDGATLGVAAVDLAMGQLIDEELDIAELAAVGAEALLLDREGLVQVRSTQKAVARTMKDYAPVRYEAAAVLDAMKAADAGHLVLADARIALWRTLGKVGLSYLVVGPEEALLGAAVPVRP